MASGTRSSFTKLRQLAQQSTQNTAVEHCELCAVVITSRHRHLLEVENRQIVCACDLCAMRFYNVKDGRFKLIPRDIYALPDFQMSAAQWDALAIPINLAFFHYNSAAEKMVAMYPSPAGPTESLLALNDWDYLVAANPVLAQMKPDVQALLVNRMGQSADYLLVPIDVCYQLVGLIRLRWRGLSGGEAVWHEIKGFFDKLAAIAIVIPAHTTDVLETAVNQERGDAHA